MVVIYIYIHILIRFFGSRQITYTATALRIEEMVPKMRVTLSRGAAINQIDHVIIYTTIQYLVFMIPGKKLEIL